MSALVKPTQQDRLLAVFRALIRSVFPRLTYLGVFSYAVQATDGVTVDAAPTDTTVPLPPLTKVTLRTGIPGSKVTPAIGSLLAVGFLNGDPSNPIVYGVFDSNTAQLVQMNGGARTIFCLGDAFSITGATISIAGTFATGGAATVTAGGPGVGSVSGPCTITPGTASIAGTLNAGADPTQAARKVQA